MRVSAKEFEILRFLDFRQDLSKYPGMMKPGTKLGFANYPEDNEEVNAVLLWFYFHWPEVVDDFGWRVDMMSQTFCDEEIAAKDTLMNYISNPQRRRELLGGQILKGTMIVPHLKMSLSYMLPFNESGYVDTNNARILELSQGNCVSMAVFPNGGGHTQLFVSETMRFVDFSSGEQVSSIDEGLNYLDTITSTIILHFLFLRFANVKQKFLARAGTRQEKKAGPNEDISEMSFPIRQLDATYFTTTIHIGEFLRRGHFRMQRHKIDGEWAHKLIWIDQTVVSGYTRKAKVLLEEGID